MQIQVHIKPVNGLIVRDPISAIPLRSEGEHKTLDAYWSRRIAEGSVIEIVLSNPVNAKAKPKDDGGI